jgi:hypothetical protein
MMAIHSREIEEAFRRYWRTGAVGENWDAWADLFTENADYVEHVLGSMKGRKLGQWAAVDPRGSLLRRAP